MQLLLTPHSGCSQVLVLPTSVLCTSSSLFFISCMSTLASVKWTAMVACFSSSQSPSSLLNAPLCLPHRFCPVCSGPQQSPLLPGNDSQGKRAHLSNSSPFPWATDPHIELDIHHKQQSCHHSLFGAPFWLMAPPSTLSPSRNLGLFLDFFSPPLLPHLAHLQLFLLLLLSSLLVVCRASSLCTWIITAFGLSSQPQGSSPVWSSQLPECLS